MQSDGPHPGQRVFEVVLPTYVMRPPEPQRFSPSKARNICRKTLENALEDRVYEAESTKELVASLGDKIKMELECLDYPRYKLLVQVTIGQICDQGVNIASRCLWDVAQDNYASTSFINSSIWANAMVFAVYTD